MKRTHLALAAAIFAASGAAQALQVDFSGYMRAGTGINARGGTQVCFGLPGADTKWRLGNECDYVIEPTFTAKIADYEGADWGMRVMPSVYRAWGQTENGTDELTTRFGQIYAFGNKISQLGNGTAWAGRRFYNRLQTGINDQFLENNDGDGAGLENMEVGPGKLSVAFMMNGRGGANDNRFSLPIRYTGLETLPNGELSIYVTPSAQLKSRDQVANTDPAKQANGIALGIYQAIGGTFGGDTLLGFKHDKQGEVKNTRFVVQQNVDIAASTQLSALGEYRLTSNAGVDSKWIALGARTDTHISGPFRVLVELGTDSVKPDNAPTLNMTKLTVAGAVSAGKDAWSRPTLRLFVTHAVWNEAARQVLGDNWINGERLRQVYGDQKSGTSIGVQTEAWW
ncbi:MAG: carbohydrate porin [Burkholderiales bacterium]|nr:carbohydrate porin [Burkholderiales bacterium]